MAMNLFSSPITLFSIALLILVLIAYTFRHFKVSPSKTIFQDIKSKRKLNKKDEKLEKKESKLERKERGIINNIFRFGRKGKNEKAKKLTKKEEKIEQKEEKVEKIKVRKDIKKYKAEVKEARDIKKAIRKTPSRTKRAELQRVLQEDIQEANLTRWEEKIDLEKLQLTKIEENLTKRKEQAEEQGNEHAVEQISREEMQIENKKRQISQKEEQIEKNESIISDEEAEEIDRLRQQNSGRNRQADRLHSEVSKIYSSMHSLAHNQMSHSAKELEHDLESEGLIIHSPTKKALSGFNKIGVIERIRDEMRKHQTNETEHIQNIITDLRMVEQLIIEFRNEFPTNLRIIANRTDNQIIKQDIETLEVAYKQLARDAEQIDKLAREYIVLFER